MTNNKYWKDFKIRTWQPEDREIIADIISGVLAQYNLPWLPDSADKDAIEVEQYYFQKGGDFWVVENNQGKVVGSAAYYPIKKGHNAVEIRKMYILPEVRGKGLGRYLLQQLEEVIKAQGYQEIWLETVTILVEAVQLYESSGYVPATGNETPRCDLVYYKKIS